MLQLAETTDDRVRAFVRALTEHADMAAQASRRAKTPADRIAHAEIEALLRDNIDKWAATTQFPELFGKGGAPR